MVSLECRESLPDVSTGQFLAVFDVLEENEISDAWGLVVIEEIFFSEGSNERLHVLQAQSGHSLFIIRYKDHLKEVNELVISDALELIPASSLLR